MMHAYFQEDNFSERFEVELRQTIAMEREKDQADRVRRKRSKKVTHLYTIEPNVTSKCL